MEVTGNPDMLAMSGFLRVCLDKRGEPPTIDGSPDMRGLSL